MFQEPPERYPWNSTPVSIPWELPTHQPSCKLLQEEPSKLGSSSAMVFIFLCVRFHFASMEVVKQNVGDELGNLVNWVFVFFLLVLMPLYEVQFAVLVKPLAV